jgi:hypothetical protein
MKNISSSFNRFLLSFLAVAMGAGLCLAGAAHAAVLNASSLPIVGVVTDAVDNSVTLSGRADIESTLIPNLAGGAASVGLSIHFNNVSGRSVISGSALSAVADQVIVPSAAGIGHGAVPDHHLPGG